MKQFFKSSYLNLIYTIQSKIDFIVLNKKKNQYYIMNLIIFINLKEII